jgi:hypothetical protein
MKEAYNPRATKDSRATWKAHGLVMRKREHDWYQYWAAYPSHFADTNLPKYLFHFFMHFMRFMPTWSKKRHQKLLRS